MQPQVNFLNTEYFFQKAYYILINQGWSGFWTLIREHVLGYLDEVRWIAILFSLVLFTFVVYSHMRAHQINHEEEAKLGGHGHGHGHSTHHGKEAHGGHADSHEHASVAVTEDEKEAEAHAKDSSLHEENKKWSRVVAHVHSENQSDWRLAILEADIMLDDMLTGMGYHGETVADKLKSIEPSDFTTLDKAWEAHKMRNTIAHEGGDFLLSQRDAERIVGLFADVFKEFHYI